MKLPSLAIAGATAFLIAVLALGAGFLGTPASATELYRKESLYNNIFVTQDGDYIYLKFGHRRLRYTESVYNPKDPTELPATYTQYMSLGTAYAKDVEKAVVIGMGGGRTSWYHTRHVPDLHLTAVELDPEIIEVAERFFDVEETERLKIVEKDGRVFMRRTDETYDIIMVDAYRGPFVPFHLLTKEFYKLLESKLNEGGVVVQNIEPTTMLYDYAMSTIGTVFDTIDIYKARGNYVAVAYNGTRLNDAQLTIRAADRQNAHGFRYDLRRMIRERSIDVPPVDPEKILTDDFAPVNYLKAVERYNQKRPETD